MTRLTMTAAPTLSQQLFGRRERGLWPLRLWRLTLTFGVWRWIRAWPCSPVLDRPVTARFPLGRYVPVLKETEPLPPAVVTETAPDRETVIVGCLTLPEKSPRDGKLQRRHRSQAQSSHQAWACSASRLSGPLPPLPVESGAHRGLVGPLRITPPRNVSLLLLFRQSG
jgi:hypothetical protein